MHLSPTVKSTADWKTFSRYTPPLHLMSHTNEVHSSETKLHHAFRAGLEYRTQIPTNKLTHNPKEAIAQGHDGIIHRTCITFASGMLNGQRQR